MDPISSAEYLSTIPKIYHENLFCNLPLKKRILFRYHTKRLKPSGKPIRKRRAAQKSKPSEKVDVTRRRSMRLLIKQLKAQGGLRGLV